MHSFPIEFKLSQLNLNCRLNSPVILPIYFIITFIYYGSSAKQTVLKSDINKKKQQNQLTQTIGLIYVKQLRDLRPVVFRTHQRLRTLLLLLLLGFLLLSDFQIPKTFPFLNRS